MNKNRVVLLCLVFLLVATSAFAAKDKPRGNTRGAFAPFPITTGTQAADLAQNNAVYMKRLTKYGGFGTDKATIVARLRTLKVGKLTASEAGLWRVLGAEGGNIFTVTQSLKAGQPVLRDASERPVMKVSCGNPMVPIAKPAPPVPRRKPPAKPKPPTTSEEPAQAPQPDNRVHMDLSVTPQQFHEERPIWHSDGSSTSVTFGTISTREVSDVTCGDPPPGGVPQPQVPK